MTILERLRYAASLHTSPRIVITGGPLTGKTTFADNLDMAGLAIRHTDDLIGELDWSEASLHVASEWFVEDGPWLVEGVTAVRALRKWFTLWAPELLRPPCDVVVYLEEFVVEPEKAGQVVMAKACRTVFDEARELLEELGVVILVDSLERIEVPP